MVVLAQGRRAIDVPAARATRRRLVPRIRSLITFFCVLVRNLGLGSRRVHPFACRALRLFHFR